VTSAVALAQALRDAARMVARVAEGKSLAEEFERLADRDSESPRSALIDLTHGTLRRYGRVQWLVRELSNRGRGDALVEALIWCALYALESGRYADYTVVDQAVRACGLLEKWNAKGFVNAVLRGFLRQRPMLAERARGDPESRYQHPAWWIAVLREAYPDNWENVLAAGNTHPPMCLRVNRRREEQNTYQERLTACGIASRRIGEAALLLERPVPVDRLPGFETGEVSVQDAGAQRAASCLDLGNGQRVLDACAAPGGKSAHILEIANVAVTALDAQPKRCVSIERTLTRLGLQAKVEAADCTRLEQWWDGSPFDRILADVPCSASGVARRHPDIKWLRRAGDLPTFAQRQGSILDALWRALRPGGKLLYATCSVFPQENDDVVQSFIARTGDARRQPPPDGEPAQWLPGPEHDGFYYSLIVKKS
jgi:16S rRNA (cytosine967-C5)-methyltransferase